MRTSIVVAALVVVVAGVECKRVNGAYCDDARPCPNGFACDLTARECHAQIVSTGDMAVDSGDLAGCACGGTTPICVAMSCVSCLSTSDGEGACAAVSPSTPHCETTGADAGACVGCRDAGDCGGATPFCDDATHACRGCLADSECPSLICDLTPGSTTHGICIGSAQVVYVDAAAAPGGDGLTLATAKQKIQDGVNTAVGLTPARLYVHVAAGTYNESVGVNNKTIYVVGAPGTFVHPTGGGKDGLGSQGGGSLTVRDLVVTADMGNGGNCNGGSLTAYRTQFINSSQLGVYSSTCQLLLDGCWVHANAMGGINVGGNFTIINSIITMNAGAGGLSQAVTGTTMVFANNTVADNTAGTTYAGATCLVAGGFAPVNSIFYNNKGAGGLLNETNCTGSFDASDDVSAGPQSTVDLTAQAPGFKGGTPLTPDSYHLTLGSPCINEGTLTAAPDHDFDFEPRPDAKSMMPDVGADELQP